MAKYFKVERTYRIYCHMYVVYQGYHLTNQTVGLASVSIYAQNSLKAKWSKAFFQSSHCKVLFVWWSSFNIIIIILKMLHQTNKSLQWSWLEWKYSKTQVSNISKLKCQISNCSHCMQKTHLRAKIYKRFKLL